MSRDLFHYPDSREFGAVVERFGFPDPSRWRHQFAVIHKRGGVTYRLTVKGLEFPGRCFHCKRNNKSASFCFFGQGARDGRAVGDLPKHMVTKLENIAMCVKLREDENDDEDASTDDSLLVFPHESEYEDMKSTVALDRVSQQHGFPPIVNLLCQPSPWRFREFFPASLFDEFLHTRVEFMLDNERGAAVDPWHESDESLEERRGVLTEVSRLDDEARRDGVAKLMNRTYLVFTSFDCTEDCQTPSPECASCRVVRGRAKKYYLDEVRRMLTGHFGKKFDRREGPFEKCPRYMPNACWDDDACQVDRLTVRADAKLATKVSKRKR